MTSLRPASARTTTPLAASESATAPKPPVAATTALKTIDALLAASPEQLRARVQTLLAAHLKDSDLQAKAFDIHVAPAQRAAGEPQADAVLSGTVTLSDDTVWTLRGSLKAGPTQFHLGDGKMSTPKPTEDLTFVLSLGGEKDSGVVAGDSRDGEVLGWTTHFQRRFNLLDKLPAATIEQQARAEFAKAIEDVRRYAKGPVKLLRVKLEPDALSREALQTPWLSTRVGQLHPFAAVQGSIEVLINGKKRELFGAIGFDAQGRVRFGELDVPVGADGYTALFLEKNGRWRKAYFSPNYDV